MFLSSFEGFRFFVFLLRQHSGCWSIECVVNFKRQKGKLHKKETVGEKKKDFCFV